MSTYNILETTDTGKTLVFVKPVPLEVASKVLNKIKQKADRRVSIISGDFGLVTNILKV